MKSKKINKRDLIFYSIYFISALIYFFLSFNKYIDVPRKVDTLVVFIFLTICFIYQQITKKRH